MQLDGGGPPGPGTVGLSSPMQITDGRPGRTALSDNHVFQASWNTILLPA
jgi:hypothetical protein